ISRGFFLWTSKPSGISLVVRERAMFGRSKNRCRSLAAWACLLATLLLHAPVVCFAWAARGMDCCTGELCPVAQHHHRKASTRDADCGHSLGALPACSMSCCPTAERAAMTDWV